MVWHASALDRSSVNIYKEFFKLSLFAFITEMSSTYTEEQVDYKQMACDLHSHGQKGSANHPDHWYPFTGHHLYC